MKHCARTVAVPVATGLPVTWTGHFYWRVRFKQDETEVSQFLQQLWEARSVELITAVIAMNSRIHWESCRFMLAASGSLVGG